MSEIALFAMACGFVAAVSWGVADFMGAKATRLGGPTSTAVVVNIVGALGYGLFFLLAGGGHGAWNATAVWYAAAAGLTQGLGQLAFFKGLNIGPVSLVSPIASAYPLVTTLGVLLFFGAHLSVRQIVGIGIIMLGVMAASEMFNLKKSERRLGAGVTFALTTAVLWGISYALLAQAVQHTSWQTASFVQTAVIAVVCLAFSPLVKGSEKVFVRQNLKLFAAPLVIGTGLIQMFGMIAVNIGLAKNTNLAPLVVAISACYPILTIMLALKHFQENFKLVPLGGAVLGIIGVVILSLG